MSELGDRIKNARTEKGWKQKHLAAELEVEPITVSRWERGWLAFIACAALASLVSSVSPRVWILRFMSLFRDSNGIDAGTPMRSHDAWSEHA